MPIGTQSPFTPQIPVTPGGTRHTHAVTIRVNGQTVGRIERFSPRQSRPVTKVFELNRFSTGRAVDQVPGVVETDEIEVQGFELWTQPLEVAIGASSDPLIHLADQANPFEIHEVWELPNGRLITDVYYGCFLSENNPDAYEAAGNKLYKKTARIHVLGRYRVS